MEEQREWDKIINNKNMYSYFTLLRGKLISYLKLYIHNILLSCHQHQSGINFPVINRLHSLQLYDRKIRST